MILPAKDKIWILLLVFVGLLIPTGCSKKGPTQTLPTMSVTPTTITRTAPYGGPSPSQVYIHVTSSEQPLEFSFTETSTWFRLLHPAMSGYAKTPDSFIVEFHVVSPGDTLPVGTYVDSIEVASTEVSNSPQYIVVTINIGTEVDLSPTHVKFTSILDGPNPPPQQFFVNSSSGEVFNYQVAHAPAWVTLTGVSGTVPDTVTINPDIIGLETGRHIDTIVIASDEVLNSPQYVVCSLSVSPWQTQPLNFTARPSWQDIYFMDQNHGWVVGLVAAGTGVQTGFIARTEDAGATWIQDTVLPTDVQENSLLSAVRFTGDEGWVVGDNGIILHTSDAGATWENQTTGLADTAIRLTDIFVYDTDTAWISGDGGLILKTTDGGAHWVKKSTPTLFRLYGLAFVNAQQGWAVGNGNTILNTTDGGETWSPQVAGSFDYKDVAFINATHGWAAGKEGTIIRTVNGGATWSSPLPTGITSGLTAVWFANDSTGWAAGEDGAIIYTRDGGLSWNQQFSDTQDAMFTLFFLNETVGWAAGENGTIRYTNSGGQ